MKKTHAVTIKLICFTITNGTLAAYLPDRRVPDVLLREGYALEEEVKNLIGKTLGVHGENGFVEQLYTVSDSSGGGTVSIVYYLLVPSNSITNETGSYWKPAFDLHGSYADDQILLYAIQRLQWKIEYTNVVYSLLPAQFTLGELQRVYEAILNRTLDKRNFRKKILSLKMVKDTGKKKTSGRARPAEVYTFVKRKPTIVEIL
jgi:8-oxo-dGTP diphosphatase